MNRVKVGVIGCGAISGAYFNQARQLPILDIVAVADLDENKAKAKAAEFHIPRVCSVEQMLKDSSVELVLNLTIPKAHGPLCMDVLNAGKHVYVEKPLGTSREEGMRVMQLAQAKKLTVGCAPDTVLGAGVQTARKLIEDGAIGRPVAFTAIMLSGGVEQWHMNPEFYYEAGGGPMFDMGPYYLTALLNILGPVKRITGIATTAIPQRTITHRDKDKNPGPKFGKVINVQTPDHIVGGIEFANGCAGTIVTSFAIKHNDPSLDGQHPIVIYGTEGALRVPDPNGFDGTVQMRAPGKPEWTDVPHAFVKGYGRAVGLADQAYAIRSGRGMRASGQQALAVLDLMQGFLDASTSGAAYTPAVSYQQPKPMPAHLPYGVLDE